MSNWLGLLHAGFACGLLYALVVVVAALVAIFAATPARRQAAQEVLKVLLFRDKKNV